MKIEHFAINVKDPVAMAKWYEKHLGLTIVRQQDSGAFTHFLADDSGDVMLEIYCNPTDQVPDYANMNPLLVHLAFVCENPDEIRKNLEAHQATFAEEVRLDDGTHLLMMRDPWGFSLQFCKRANKMLKMQQ